MVDVIPSYFDSMQCTKPDRDLIDYLKGDFNESRSYRSGKFGVCPVN